nr:chondroitin proteoglycan-2-like [Onthophagus taurus]
MIYVVLITTTLVITLSSSTKLDQCPSIDEFSIHLPHENDCTRYYQCKMIECPPNLHFNPELGVCDWPQTAGCEPGTGTTTQSTGDCDDTTTTCAGGTTTESGVGVICPENGVHLPHESDCTKFYICDWGKPILQQCPGGLHFNPSLQVCDWPANAGCEANVGSSTTPNGNGEETSTPNGNIEETTTSSGNGEQTTTPAGNGGETTTSAGNGGGESCNGIDCTTESVTTPIGGGGSTGGWDGVCPEENGENIVLLPHETDCNKFYKCDWGKPILQQCPDGLHFNPSLQVCDWPANAGCEVNGGGSTTPNGNGEETSTPNGNIEETTTSSGNGEQTTTPAGNGGETTTSSGNGGGESCNGIDCTTESVTTPIGGGGSTGGWNGVCPEGNGENVVLLPHETDCNQFYKCDWGKPILQQCPDGLHFNPSLQVCDWPANAGCEVNGGGSTTPNGNGEETSTPNGNIEETTTSSGNGEQTTTPAGNGGETTTSAGNGGGESCNGIDCTTESVTTPIGGGGSTGGWDGVCPEENGENVVLLPHETDCNKFYKCDWGKPILQQCPDGLHFNPSLQVCDWPAEAGCEGNGGGITTPNGNGEETTTSNGNGGENTTPPGNGGGEGCNSGDCTTEKNTTPIDGGGSTGGWNGICPEKNGEDLVLLPHETDCTKFYKCDWGTPVLYNCTDGLHFNPVLGICDRPEDAGCSENSGGGTTPGGNGGGENCNGIDCTTEKVTTPGNGGEAPADGMVCVQKKMVKI